MLGLVGMEVIFASLGMGEAVYRLLFFDFDGATDRLPIEMLFGLAFAWIVTRLAKRITSSGCCGRKINNDLGPELQDSSRSQKQFTPVPYPAISKRSG